MGLATTVMGLGRTGCDLETSRLMWQPLGRADVASTHSGTEEACQKKHAFFFQNLLTAFNLAGRLRKEAC